MNIVVIYSSKYGTTKQYAQWIAEALNAKLFERHKIKADQLNDFDIVIYGGGLYAGGISGVNLVTKNPCKNLVIFTVGLAPPESTDYSGILEKNLTSEMIQNTKIFHLHGGIDYKKLGIVHKAMMVTMMMIIKKAVAKKDESEISNEDKEFLASYGKKMDFTSRQNILPLVEYVNRELILK